MIQTALPHYRTDAILRKENLDRYDDRDDIRVNLLRSYERLMQFIAKHLNDKFYLEGTQRISIRDKIFREAITNSLIHREFSNRFPAKMIIERDRVYFENGNKSRNNDVIDPEDFTPYPKNPKIAKFFREIGWVDELGSGVRNIYKYNRIYSGADPQFIEGDVFKTIIPLTPQDTTQADTPATTQGNTLAEVVDSDERTLEILQFCKEPKSRKEIQDFIGIKNSRDFRRRILSPLVKKRLLKLTLPEKPSSPKQKYYSGT
ncbi:Putative ATP-dependent DNA helicase recG C-terminal [Dethiosulfatibacter aminovorans DSM 17477]|uniref:Putative ATP-dependent DNA helicase recG C-terminal n=1 Tax=Dethiosulfatibacter aminovorans DSM 17477 TaxID=1121476 RepID=A0A1M6MS87_9FIRM|nr:ATP-binding protein [Dethiosulfatibacter aminovorans]SHJ86259.1 Putative ATP-dependent DNA helicase recG C-terminal [Dethiosulfatibacter aminovorans DSM 17477]